MRFLSGLWYDRIRFYVVGEIIEYLNRIIFVVEVVVMIENIYLNKELCKECGGNCCKTMGCHYSPEDFKDISYESLKKEIERGHISIDWWEGDPADDGELNIGEKAFFLRVRNIGAGIVDASWGGVCMLLGEDGCILNDEDRPKGGRLLVPCEDGKCEVLYSKQQAAIDWLKYKDILLRLYDEYNEGRSNNDINELLDMMKALFS